MFTTVQLVSPQNTAKSESFVFWFLSPWARLGASYIGDGIQVWVPVINRRVTGN
jgi:hypothetical protein|tara:strand:+ start:1299 stop:1460 length:162 start_codon:yes stop_codon:yes gene_type:complete